MNLSRQQRDWLYRHRNTIVVGYLVVMVTVSVVLQIAQST